VERLAESHPTVTKTTDAFPTRTLHNDKNIARRSVRPPVRIPLNTALAALLLAFVEFVLSAALHKRKVRCATFIEDIGKFPKNYGISTTEDPGAQCRERSAPRAPVQKRRLLNRAWVAGEALHRGSSCSMRSLRI
jgi:hypothetical protein